MIKSAFLILSFSLLAIASCSSPEEEPIKTEEKPVESTIDNPDISYNLGLLLGAQAKRQFDEINFDELKKGFQKSFEGHVEEKDFTNANDILHSYQHIQLTQKTKAATENGTAYRAENAKREGVVVTTSGLQYEIIQAGDGPNPTVEDTVTIHYRGTLINGTEFDSSYKRGKPASFPLKNLIKGWQEGVPLMKEGAKYKFVVPPELGYGGNNAGQIPPNSTLVFEIELIKVGEPEESATPELSQEK